MGLRFYDTRRRTVVPFTPRVAGTASMYVCGPTVQAGPHVGHLRTAVAFDVARRWLVERGLRVVFASNVTDIDDKILQEAARLGEPWWALAERNSRAFDEAYRAVGCLPPTVVPRATGHIPQMLDLTARLVAAGSAYPAGGDVYFDVRSFADYGALSGQRPDAMEPAEDAARAKRDPLDFTLWKAAKPGEPRWESPWGPGRPGWHLECSAMSTEYLGSSFDIHGAGRDLLFPHHENELAQSVAAGDGFAGYWLHSGLVNVGAAKMSKSLGNSLGVDELLSRARAVVLRYALLAAHYRSDLDWSEETLTEADAAWRRVEGFLRAAGPAAGAATGSAAGAAAGAATAPAEQRRWAEFAAAMDDDLGVPRALAVLHSAVREGNAALAGGDSTAVAACAAAVERMVRVLGLTDAAGAPDSEGVRGVVDGLVALILEARAGARTRGDFPAADRIRDELTRLGVAVEDTTTGVRWHLE